MIINSEYHKLKNDEKLLYLAGIPLTSIKRPASFQQMSFCPVSCKMSDKTRVIDGIIQKNTMQDILQKVSIIGRPVVYAIGSHPTEKPCLDLASIISKAYNSYVLSQHKLPEIKWFDLGSMDWNYLKSDKKPELVVIHGLSDTSDNKKIEMAKDLSRAYCYSTMLAVIHSTNCYEYAYHKIGLTLSGVFQLGRVVNKTF